MRLVYTCFRIVLDVCSVNNGGCDANADCSHAAGSDVCMCKCKAGFVNTATTGPVVCKGNALSAETIEVDKSDSISE